MTKEWQTIIEQLNQGGKAIVLNVRQMLNLPDVVQFCSAGGKVFSGEVSLQQNAAPRKPSPPATVPVQFGQIITRDKQLFVAEQVPVNTENRPPCGDCGQRVVQLNSVRWHRKTPTTQQALCTSCAKSHGLSAS